MRLKSSLLSLLLLLVGVSSLRAAQGLELARFNPGLVQPQVYHSFEQGLLLVALEAKGTSRFSCAPNRYLVYQAQGETFTWFEGGNLLLSPDLTELVYLKIHTLDPVLPDQVPAWEAQAKGLVSQMQVGPVVLEEAAMSDGQRQCWQQPVRVSLAQGDPKPLPFLAANLCKKRWCSQLSYEGPRSLRLWVRLEPKQVHFVKLDLETGLAETLRSGPSFTKEDLVAVHAPREDLLKGKDLQNAQLPLAQGARLILRPEGGEVSLVLLRKSPDPQTAQARLKAASEALQAGAGEQALAQGRQAAWADPSNFEAKYFVLTALASAGETAQLFETLLEDFSAPEKDKACGQMHLDEAFKKLKQQALFLQQFKANCQTPAAAAR